MELSRRRFMQAAGVVAAGSALDLGLPAPSWAASTPPIPITGTPGIYGSWSNVKLPGTTAMQCFGFGDGILYVCQNGGDGSTALTFTQYSSASDKTYKSNVLDTTSHGGGIGVNGPTIWTPTGAGNEIVSGNFDPSQTGFTPKNGPFTPPGMSDLKVNVDASNLVLRDINNTLNLYDLSQVKSAGSGFPAPLAAPWTIPPKTDTYTNVGHDVTDTWVYYATQTAAQQNLGGSPPHQFTLGYYNFADGTTAQTPHNFPTISGSSYELEGLAIVGSAIVVGVNNGPTNGMGSAKSFSLVTLT
jgi:hypothetical protein